AIPPSTSHRESGPRGPGSRPAPAADPAAPANAGPSAHRRSVRSRASGATIPTARSRAPPTAGGSGCSAHRSAAPVGHPLLTPFAHSCASDACSRRPGGTLLVPKIYLTILQVSDIHHTNLLHASPLGLSRPTWLLVDFPAWPAPRSADAADGGSPPRPSLRPSTSVYSCSGIAGPPAAFPPTEGTARSCPP